MNHSDIAALMKGAAPVIRDLIAASVAPLLDRIDGLERELRERDDAEMVRALVADAVAALPPAVNGKDGERGLDGAPGLPGVDGKDGVNGADGLPGVDGKDGTDGAPGKDGERGIDGAAGRDGIDGKDGANGTAGADGAPGLPGADGKDGAPGERGADGLDGKDGTPGKDGERGADGAPGKLPMVKAWAAGVHYEGDVVSRGGATYQALRDSANEPPHDDWVCIAAAGRDGLDGRSFTIRGTYASTNEYQALDVVALNGGAFVAKTDDPGECPGAGWQLLASQGKTGKPGERGMVGHGERGEAGPAVVGLYADEQGMLTLVNGDGSTVDLDLYPLLSKIGAA